MGKKKRDLKAIASWQERLQMQKASETLYDELCSEFAKVQTNARKFRQARAGTEMYDQAWANFYVSLNVLETKARSLQEVLD
jgi:hypothetical protein